MKTIDRLLIRNFLKPFVLIFLVAMFVLILQLLWKHIDDLVGKGLELSIIAELVFYMSATVVPLALPVAVLIAGIMTFGDMGEHYELVVLKSAGVSLFRFVMPLLILATFISMGAFLFSNYVLPVSNLKLGSLMWSVNRKRPALNIKPGVYYNGIDNYVIRVNEKSPDGQILYDIKIHDHSGGKGNTNVLLAEKGEMFNTEGDKHLMFKLFNGVQYSEGETHKKDGKNEFRRTHFEEYEMLFDMSKFDLKEADPEMFKNHRRMLNVQQLYASADSLKRNDERRVLTIQKRVASNYSILKDSMFTLPASGAQAMQLSDKSLLQCLDLSDSDKALFLKKGINSASGIKSNAISQSGLSKGNGKTVRKFLIEFHTKFALSLACLILFLIGAPLGALIRKGGFGIPLVVGILFFILFHILFTLGRKSAEEGAVEVFWGIWMAIFILLPIGFYLIYVAKNDLRVFRSISFARLSDKLTGFVQRLKKNK